MAFHVTSEITDTGIAKITLSGELDAGGAPTFKAEIEQVAVQQAKRLVLLLQDLDYMASAGLRVLVFARQKMGANVDIYVVGAQESVIETIEMTGFHHSVIILDAYDPLEIESLP